MELAVEVLMITTGGSRIAILSEESASLLGVHSSDRIRLVYGKQELIAIANIAPYFPKNRVGTLHRDRSGAGGRGTTVKVTLAPLPESLFNVRAKLRGERLREQDMVTIVKDVVERHLSTVEIAGFLTALSIHGLSSSENEALSRAMVATGKTLNFGLAQFLINTASEAYRAIKPRC